MARTDENKYVLKKITRYREQVIHFQIYCFIVSFESPILWPFVLGGHTLRLGLNNKWIVLATACICFSEWQRVNYNMHQPIKQPFWDLAFAVHQFEHRITSLAQMLWCENPWETALFDRIYILIIYLILSHSWLVGATISDHTLEVGCIS